jgi:hypothetical protein
MMHYLIDDTIGYESIYSFFNTRNTSAIKNFLLNFHRNKDFIYLSTDIGMRFASKKLLVISFLLH